MQAPQAERGGNCPASVSVCSRRSRRKKSKRRHAGYPEEVNPLVYKPQPIDTSGVQLSEMILDLTERLAENTHDIWARQRSADGWTWGPRRDQDEKEHPSLVPYEELPESEKEYDRSTAMEMLKAMIGLEYRIERVE
jgi:hypothetical protein